MSNIIDEITLNGQLPAAHPGVIFGRSVLPDLGLAREEVAKRLDLPEESFRKLLAGEVKVTPGIAARLGVLAGNGADVWMELQKKYDVCTP